MAVVVSFFSHRALHHKELCGLMAMKERGGDLIPLICATNDSVV
jgi:hypothetical protein